ncbi:ATP-binding protein [Acidithiobacillus ferrooxidans]|uniref:AAA family ATPase n=1 Tax=Acidithiobacillus ferrooxidans TaxID=920 RepID=UPI00214869CC|nr:ATP-binding protein [Acidithiobacillus ferrooxidans]MCR1355843.1 ATP-binding protein [Acidithiobacillus ferrooxidans]
MAKKTASHTVQDSDWDLEEDIAFWPTWEIEPDPLEHWVRYWGLRILRLRGRQMGAHWWLIQDRQLMTLLEWTEEEYTEATVTRKLRRVIEELRALPKPEERGSPIFLNIARLAARLELNVAEQRILLLAALGETYDIVSAVLDELSEWTLDRVAVLLAEAIELDTTLVHQALLPHSVLRSCGLLQDLHEKDLRLMPGMASLLLQEHENEDALFAPLFHPLAASTLTLEDFPHLQEHSERLMAILEGAWREQEPGVHILLHGAPGTGKTEYALALAKALNAAMVEVRSQDAEQNPIEGDDRFRAYALSQQALGRQPRSLILFDEVEDVFVTSLLPWAPRVGAHKGWTNRLLERAKVPTIWISNSIEGIDPAYRRRMIYELEFTAPPKAVRQRIIARQVQDLAISEEHIARWAKEASLTPGSVQQAARAMRLMGIAASAAPSHALEMLLEQRGHEFSRRPSLEFDIDLLECDQDLPTVLQQLRDLPDARLLLHGPSGTGKTAFAKHVAEVLGKEMHQFLASDILGRYVGETEQNIAAAFRRARGGVLFLDEADSFLSSREFTTHPWEISAVNELLQQMDSFRGTLIMATNLLRALDSAVFRRFDWILAFVIPSRQRQERILAHLLRSLPVPIEDIDPQVISEKISPLTLSVASTVYRRLKRQPNMNIRTFSDTLVSVCANRTCDGYRKVGF